MLIEYCFNKDRKIAALEKEVERLKHLQAKIAKIENILKNEECFSNDYLLDRIGEALE